MVTSVLLNVEWMWTTPSLTTRFCFFFLTTAGFSVGVVASFSLVFAMATPSARSGLLRRLLLAGDGAARSLARARVAVRALAVHRQVATVAQTAVGPEVHVALDVHRHVAPQVAFDLVGLVDHLAQLHHLVV